MMEDTDAMMAVRECVDTGDLPGFRDDYPYYVDAQTRDACCRLTSFGPDIEAVTKAFLEWARGMNLKADDLWYAHVICTETIPYEHIANLTINGRGVELYKPKKAVNPYKRKSGFLRRLLCKNRNYWQN